MCVLGRTILLQIHVLQLDLETSVTKQFNTMLKKCILRIPDEMVFNKETVCSLHYFIEGIMNDAYKNLKNVHNGNIRYVYC